MNATRIIKLVMAAAAAVAVAVPFAVAQASSVPYRLQSHVSELSVYTNPQLGRSRSEIVVYMDPARGEIARIVVFVPQRYTLDLARPAGAQIGRAAARDARNNGAIVPLMAVTPAAHSGNSCAPGTHEAVWEFQVGTTPIQVFVDRTSAAEAAFGAYKLELCLPPTASLGIDVRRVNLVVDPLVNPTSRGTYTWRAFVTPYVAGVGSQFHSFEVRARVPLPMHLTLRAQTQPRTRTVILTGRYRSAYLVRGVPVDLWVRRDGMWRYVRSTRTDARGRYSFRRRVRTTSEFSASASGFMDCEPGSPAPAGCVRETLSEVFSPSVRVRPPRRR